MTVSCLILGEHNPISNKPIIEMGMAALGQRNLTPSEQSRGHHRSCQVY